MMINNYVTVPFLERLIEGENYFSIIQGADESELSKNLAELFKTVKSKTEGYAYTTISLLFKLLCYIDLHKLYERNEHYMKESGKLIWLKCVMNLIKQKYGEQISLAQMADSAGFSPKYFCRVFHEITHYTPMEYLNQYRINRAAEMLLSTDESIEDIAYDCGVNDISYFIKLFKRYKNKTPLKYRTEGLNEKS